MTRAVTVEVLHTDGCARWEAARERVVVVARELRVPIDLRETLIATPDEAIERRFPGSPTLRVDGRDVQPEVDDLGDFGLG
jgi:hypothetical protein